MNQPIDLPNQSQAFYRKALRALEKNQKDQAIQLLHKSYQLDQNFPAFQELVYLAIAQKDKDTIKKLWQESDYSGDTDRISLDLTTLYAHSLPFLTDSKDCLIQLYQLHGQYQTLGWDPSIIHPLIKEQEEKISLIKEIESTSPQAYLASLQDQDAFYQLQTLKTIYQIDLAIKLPILLALLQSPKICQFIKGDILHHLLTHPMDDPIQINWFNQERSISLAKLLPYRQHPTYFQLINLLDDYCKQNNPHLYNLLEEQINLLVMTYYPFLDEMIKSPSTWFNCLLGKLQIEDWFCPDLNVQKDFDRAWNEIQSFWQ